MEINWEMNLHFLYSDYKIVLKVLMYHLYIIFVIFLRSTQLLQSVTLQLRVTLS